MSTQTLLANQEHITEWYRSLWILLCRHNHCELIEGKVSISGGAGRSETNCTLELRLQSKASKVKLEASDFAFPPLPTDYEASKIVRKGLRLPNLGEVGLRADAILEAEFTFVSR